MNDFILDFESLLEKFPAEVSTIDTAAFHEKSIPEKWSKKEILGHLIDSAMTNYLRFIRAQSEENPQIFYVQDMFCENANYQQSETKQLLDLWLSLNRQLLFLFKTVLAKNLTMRKCNDLTLAFLMEDYVAHLNHHRHQILA
ncbi:DinB family protein [Sphingobacterium sp.]|uniref:DinB family protein n=1 Tax=Sphingobacterium sp. TaxID=341027 RepID=UPI0031DE6B39